MATDKELLAEARQVIKEQSDVLERLAAAAMPYGVVIAKDGKKLVVATDKGLLSVEDSGTKIGETVLLEPMSNQIFETANLPKIGPTVEVQDITEYGAVIATHGEPRIVALGQHKPKKGDRIMLDPSGSVVIAVIERAKPPYVPTVESVSWDDIGGQDNAKRLLIEAVELPRKHPAIYAHYGKKPTKGILLSGPPGCVDGDALVCINRGGKGYSLPLRELVAKHNGEPFNGTKKQRNRSYAWDMSIPTMVRCYHNGEFRLRKLLGAYPKGVKEVYKLVLADGKTLRLTADHEVLLKHRGWSAAETIAPGNIVLVNGVRAPTSPKHPRYLAKGYWHVSVDLSCHPFLNHREGHLVPEHRLIAEAALNGYSLDEWVNVVQNKMGGGKTFIFLSSTDHVHHKDGDPTNNDISNLEIVTQSEHSVLHEFHRHLPVFLAKEVKVVSCEPDGETEVFDITVEEAHNFTANGIVVHNCGKTMLAKAVATSVGSTGGFIAVKGPEILDPYVGVAEANVRDLFRKAEDWKTSTGHEAVVFIDEAEAILAKRGGHFSYMEKTIVPMFLTEMDGLESSAAIVILATNRADLLDPAVVRDGRIDYKVEVARPDIKEAKEIMKIHLRGKPVHGSRQELIEKAVQHIYMQELPYSGALFAGLVQKASARAIARDIAAGKLTGVCHEDFAHAVQTIKDQEGLSYAA